MRELGGWKSVAELRREMSSLEWREWYTYFRRRNQEEELAMLKAKARGGKK